MGLKRVLYWLLFISGSIGITFVFVIIINNSIILGSSAESSAKSSTVNITQLSPIIIGNNSGVVKLIDSIVAKEKTLALLPTRLIIPKIKVDAVFEYVNIDASGAMDVPKNSKNVAWFQLGPYPGEVGSAVIAGHYGIKDGKGSVFDNLHKLRSGDKIYVENNKGEIITFVVRTSKRYNPNDDAYEVFVSTDGQSHLNLVTCEGVWDKKFNGYTKRLVVFADKE